MLSPDCSREHSRVDHSFSFKVGVIINSRERELETTVPIINFSNNKFSGRIPASIEDLMLLIVLDLSHNEITGEIPSSIGKLHSLVSLDLSRNRLTGEIPSLTDLTFLSFLNLSFNSLTGKVPSDEYRLQTFLKDSYMGNVGLCGLPLNVRCGNANDSGSSSMQTLSNRNDIEWMYVSASVGYTVGLGMFSMALMFCGKWRNKLFLQVDLLLVKVFEKKMATRNGPEWREPIRRP